MSQTKLALLKQYREGLEDHLELREGNEQLLSVGKYALHNPIDGNEVFSDTLKGIGTKALSATKWASGQTWSLLNKSFNNASNLLLKSIGNNKLLLENIRRQLPEDLSINLNVAQVGSITSTGHIEDFESDLDDFIKTLEITIKHSKDVSDYLHKQLSVIKELRNAKQNTDVLNIVDKFEAITYPVYNLPNKNGDARISDVLPDGKVLKFIDKDENITYSMSGDKPAGESGSITLTKSEMTSILNKTSKVNDLLKQIKQSYDQYLDVLKAWSDAVKAVDNTFDKQDHFSSHVLSEAEGLLKGSEEALTFYVMFVPRVVNMTDKYIHNVLSLFAKS